MRGGKREIYDNDWRCALQMQGTRAIVTCTDTAVRVVIAVLYLKLVKEAGMKRI